MPLRDDAQTSRLPLEADAAERSGSRASAAAGDAGRADHADVGDEIARGDTDDAEVARCFASDFAGELIRQAASVRGARDGVPIVEAFGTEVVALEARLVGEVFQTGLQQVDAGVERLRDDLLAAEKIAHYELHVAAAVDRRNVGNRERSRRHGPLRDQRVVDEHVHRRR